MGLSEIQQHWVAGGQWEAKLEEWQRDRDRDLPTLRSIVDRFLSGEFSPGAFRDEMDVFSRETHYAGFHGTGGQMFLNLLVKSATADELETELRTAIRPPMDEAEAETKLSTFRDFVADLGVRAIGANRPAPGSAPYFLSFFWEAADRENWPIYYPASRKALQREGLFSDSGSIQSRYLAFRERILELKQMLQTDTWGVEALLWELNRVATETSAEHGESPVTRAWLMRGANIGGENFVPYFLRDGFIAVGWDAVTPLVEGMTREEITVAIRDAFPEESTGTISNWAGIDHRFVNLVRSGDLVLTPDGRDIYIGEVTSASKPATYNNHSVVRRSVDWLNPDTPIKRPDIKDQYPSLYSKMRTLLTITDLKEDGATVAALAGLIDVPPPPPPLPPPGDALVPDATAALAARLFLPVSWLQELVEILNEKNQLIFYGPPGTGKTFVAQALGEHIEEVGGEYELVQFHPSYSYEDFFEGFRPTQAAGDALGFELTPGPLRRVAERAAANPTRPYLLVIDEINRGNIAKIFGEMYFLLEYRNREITLQYSPATRFSLPPNLYVIGTMNTADRSIALVDSALRRRFYFVPFMPRDEPLRDVLPQWLSKHGLDDEPALLLASLNAALQAEPAAGDEFAIGPSYFMVKGASGGPNLEHVWRYAITPLLEERFYGAKSAAEIQQSFGLSRVRNRAHVASADEPADEVPNPEP